MCWFTQARAGLQSLGKQEATLQSASWVQSVSSQWQGCSQAVGTCGGQGWGAASQWKPSPESQVICMVEQVLAESPMQSMNPSGNRLLIHRAGRWLSPVKAARSSRQSTVGAELHQMSHTHTTRSPAKSAGQSFSSLLLLQCPQLRKPNITVTVMEIEAICPLLQNIHIQE